jgi:hypothetical protein
MTGGETRDGGSSGPAGAAAGQAFICGTCGRRYPAAGDCPDCPGSALLDLRQADVRELLEEIDDRARRSRDQRWLWVGVVVGVALVGLLNGFPFWQTVRRSTIVLPFFLDQIILMAFVAAGLQRLLVKLFPAKRVTPPGLTLPSGE